MCNQFGSQRYNELFPSSDGDWIDASTIDGAGTWQRFVDRHSDRMCLLRPLLTGSQHIDRYDIRYAINGYELIRIRPRDYGMVECVYRPISNAVLDCEKDMLDKLGVTSIKTVDNDDGTYTHTYIFKVDD